MMVRDMTVSGFGKQVCGKPGEGAGLGQFQPFVQRLLQYANTPEKSE
jgi:hypothetical protein